MASKHRTVTIDCDYLMARFAASYLITQGDRAAFIDNNTTHAVPKLLEALTQTGLSPAQVDWIIITHVHLDHASGSAALMEACPNARLLCHPRAAPHVIDPSKLAASARQVYGDAEFERLYSEIRPIPASRVRAMEDGERLEWGSRPLRFLHTRGHANHHFCVHDETEHAIFTGDAFGLAYPDLQTNGLFILPSTSPTDFDAPLAREALDRIVATGARRAYLTHFGAVHDLEEGRRQLREHLDFSEALLEQAEHSPLPDPELDSFCEQRLRAWLLSRPPLLQASPADRARFEGLLKLDLELNAQGIAHIARKRRAKAGASPT